MGNSLGEQKDRRTLEEKESISVAWEQVLDASA